MNRLLLASSVLVVFAASATAADLPSRNQRPVAPVVAAPSFTWTGLYAGLNAGYGWSSPRDATYRGDALALGAVAAGQLPFGYRARPSGFAGGVQLGYNYQIGQIVVGAETDIQYLGMSKRTNYAGALGTNSSMLAEQSYLGTLRARLGFTPMDRLLVYGTGGLAYGDSKKSIDILAPGGAQWGGSRSETKVGWALGAGAEYAFTNNWTAKLEYLYYDLGKGHVYHAPLNAAGAAAANSVGAVRGETNGQIVRAGLNYKF